MLLHETGGRKENWYFLVKAMARRGLGALALDLRGHGGSQNPPAGQPAHWRKFPSPTKAYNEFNNMTLDVEAAVEYLQTQGVMPHHIAMGGADVGSSIALRYAAVHSQVPLLFMLSPGMSYREVLTVNAIRAYTKRPILLVAGADDNRSTRETAVLVEFAKRSAGPENTVLMPAEREHGTRMLMVNKDLIGKILDWVENPVEPPDLSTAAPAVPVDPDAVQPLPTDDDLGRAPEPASGAAEDFAR